MFSRGFSSDGASGDVSSTFDVSAEGSAARQMMQSGSMTRRSNVGGW